MNPKSKNNIFIAGDTMIDRHIYVNDRELTNGYPETILKSEMGGAAQLFKILTNFQKFVFLKKTNVEDQYREIFAKNKLNIYFREHIITGGNNNKQILSSFLYWKLFDNADDSKSWRISEKTGFGMMFPKGAKNVIDANSTEPEIKNNGILLIDDAVDLRSNEDKWTGLLEKETYDQIVLKISHPVSSSKILYKLTQEKKYSDKLIIITSANELRKANIKISSGISWEQTATDLVLELKNNNLMQSLNNCQALIVTFSTDGAFYFFKDSNANIKYRLLFDNERLDNEFNIENIKGDAIGFQNTFTSAVIIGLLLDRKEYKYFESMINNGLSATRKLLETGHGNISKKDIANKKNYKITGFPYNLLFNEYINPHYRYAVAFVPQIQEDKEPDFINWSILKGNYSSRESEYELFDDAYRFAMHGKKALNNTPAFSIGNYYTIDRSDIESLRNIKKLIQNYIADKEQKIPLSIAVFGAPGSGKSFAVKQLVKGLLNEKPLEFNLSQFGSANDLNGAFHQIRDRVLSGKLAVAFWDEFDSKAFFWLQYLLAPMQDGAFQEGQLTHNIGKCIFIFAGGTSYDFEHFGYSKSLPDEKDFKLKKGPDFKSRLNGYINILGPNRSMVYDSEEDGWEKVDYNKNDVSFPIRRAILFRGISGYGLNNDLPNDFDYGLLYVILNIDEYKHGVRSLEKITRYVMSEGKGKFLRSNLPPRVLLDSHVDYDKFMSLIDAADTYIFKANKIAKNIHEGWMNIGDKSGWKLDYHKGFDFLPSHIKRDNVDAAVHFRKHLSLVDCEISFNDLGAVNDFNEDILKISNVKQQLLKYLDNENICEMDGKLFSQLTVNVDSLKKVLKYISANCTTDKSDKSKFFIDDAQLAEIDNILGGISKIAIAEHDRWKKSKLDNNWKKGERNDDLKQHNCIVEYSELALSDKFKDLDAVLSIQDNLRKVGLFIRKKPKNNPR